MNLYYSSITHGFHALIIAIKRRERFLSVLSRWRRLPGISFWLLYPLVISGEWHIINWFTWENLVLRVSSLGNLPVSPYWSLHTRQHSWWVIVGKLDIYSLIFAVPASFLVVPNWFVGVMHSLNAFIINELNQQNLIRAQTWWLMRSKHDLWW